MRLALLGGQLVSQSQGKWVVERATQFKTVVLDFEGVALKSANLNPVVAQAVRMFAPWVGG